MDHYINTAAPDFATARVIGPQNLSPAPFPTLCYGDKPTHNFMFSNRSAPESWSGDASNGLRVTLGAVDVGPVGGSFALTCNQTTPALPLPMDAPSIQNAVNLLTTVIAEGGIDVTGTFPNFLFAWRTVGVKTALSVDPTMLVPVSGAAVTVLQAGTVSLPQRSMLTLRANAIDQTTTWTPITSPAAGWSGVISTNTAAALTILLMSGKPDGGFLQADTLLTVERIQPNGTYQTVYQTPVTLRAKDSDLGSTGSPAFSSYVTSTLFLSNAIQNRSAVVGLASATADPTKLGGLPTAAGALTAGVAVVLNFAVAVNDGAGSPHAGLLTLIYQLLASTHVTAAPLWLRPYDYSAGTNAVAWRLLCAALDTLPAAYNTDTGCFHYLGAAGAVGAVYTYTDQTGTASPA